MMNMLPLIIHMLNVDCISFTVCTVTVCSPLRQSRRQLCPWHFGGPYKGGSGFCLHVKEEAFAVVCLAAELHLKEQKCRCFQKLIITWESWVWHSLSYVSLVLMCWDVGLLRPSGALDGREPSSFSYFSTFRRTRPFCGSEGKHAQKWYKFGSRVCSLARQTGSLQRDNTVIQKFLRKAESRGDVSCLREKGTLCHQASKHGKKVETWIPVLKVPGPTLKWEKARWSRASCRVASFLGLHWLPVVLKSLTDSSNHCTEW